MILGQVISKIFFFVPISVYYVLEISNLLKFEISTYYDSFETLFW